MVGQCVVVQTELRHKHQKAERVEDASGKASRLSHISIFFVLGMSRLHKKKRGKPFYLQLELFRLQLSFFACSPLRPLLDALSHCKQKSSKCK